MKGAKARPVGGGPDVYLMRVANFTPYVGMKASNSINASTIKAPF
jgi:hypothetical protein